MVNQEGIIGSNNEEKLKTVSNECAIITLTPKIEVFKQLREVSFDMLDVPEEELNKFLNQDFLSIHTVSVCIPIMFSPDDLYQFIKDNSEKLINMMLASWPFPLATWDFFNKNIDLFNKLIDVKYYPIICKAIYNRILTTLDLAVTIATPTNDFIDYLAEYINSHQSTLSEDEIDRLDLITATGVAIITNKIEKKRNQDLSEFFEVASDAKNFLIALKDKIVQTLFYFYFKNQADFPKEMDNSYLNKWFDTKTFVSLYYLLPPK